MPLSPQPANSIADVINTLTTIDAALPDTDGLKWFNHLYLRVTQSVDGAVGRGTFQDPQWITRLDVVFANLYFEAVMAAESADNLPPSWQPLFDARNQPGIHEIQFALAGMNAHINRDLPVALVQMATANGNYPTRANAQFQDFQAVNGLLTTVEQQVKAQLLAGLPPTPALADVIAMWSVERARDAAWNNGEILWHLQPVPLLATAFLDTLDHTIGLAGRGLLIRTLGLSA